MEGVETQRQHITNPYLLPVPYPYLYNFVHKNNYIKRVLVGY